MNATVGFLLCLVAPAFGLAQQELPVGSEGTAPILEKIQTAPLSDDQKQQVRQAVQAHDYKTAEVIVLHAIDANAKSVELLTLSAAVFLLDKNPLNTAIL